MDFHAWIEINGQVIDWNTESSVLSIEYDMIALIRLKTIDYEIVYQEWVVIEDVIQQFVNTQMENCRKIIDSIGTKASMGNSKRHTKLLHSTSNLVENEISICSYHNWFYRNKE